MTFDGIQAIPKNWSNTSIVVPVPSGAMTGNVAVMVNGMTNNGPVFTLLPSISGLSPSAGPVGTVVTVSGSGFGATQGTSSIAFGQVAGVVSLWSQNQIVVSVPPGAVTAPVVVTVPAQTGNLISNLVTFTVGSATTATISGTVTQFNGVTPIAGATVTAIEGSNTVASTVTNASGFFSLSNIGVATYNLQVSAPGYGYGSQSEVTTSAGQTTVVNFSLSGQTITYTYDEVGRLVGVTNSLLGSAKYTYDAVGNILSISNATSSQTAILDFTPKSGPAGTAVTITGISFSGNTQQDAVTLGSVSATVSSATSTQLAITVPTAAITGPISVTTPSGTATSTIPFTITAPTVGLSITSFTPAVANVGESVTITGTGYDVLANDRVTFNGPLATLSAANSTSLSATVPVNAKSGPITVSTPLGSATSSSDFFVVPTNYTSGQVDFTGQISLGGSYTGTILNGGDIGIVLFNGVEGEGFNLQITNSSIASGTVLILNPDGSTLITSAIGTGSTLLNPLPAPSTGIYTILVESYGAGYTGSLTLNLTQIPQGATTSGTTQPVTFTAPGQVEQFTFKGTEGQLASVAISNFTLPNFSTYISIICPDGTPLIPSNGVNGYGSSWVAGLFTLPVTGTYTILVTPTGGVTGSLSLTLWLFNNIVGTTTSGAQNAVIINDPEQNEVLQFSGTAGQLASAMISNDQLNDSYGMVNVSILNPDGSMLESNTIYNGFPSLQLTVLPTTGIYTLLIVPTYGGSYGGIGSITVTLWLYQNLAGPTVTSGTVATIATSTPGQDEQLTFNGTAGQSATVQITDLTFAANYNSIGCLILNPNGSVLTSSSGYYDLGCTATLPTTGNYSLYIAPTLGGAGSANVTLTLQ